ncbi:MAG: maleylpyruvate isomerase N-terminal domain-containing protein [Dehalococcoidia bacterium]|nr:maleylpyruvate isomerase N-terminal domain-containing protein [Dehalococcoidia bacterium]
MIRDLDFRDKGMDRYVRRAAEDMAKARDELMSALGRITDGDWARYVPYGSRTLHDVLSHLATADQTWALATRELLKGEAEDLKPRSPEALQVARQRAIARGRTQAPAALVDEMVRRRRLLLGLYELLEPRHLALQLPAFGDAHNSVREHIWLGYHDRLHAADIRRALRLQWYPPKLRLLPELRDAADARSSDATLYVVYSIDPMRWEHPSPVLGWSNRELLAHLATGDWVLQQQLRHVIERGSLAAWPDVDAGNAQRVHERRFSTHAALVEEYLSMRHETRLLLARLKPKQLGLATSFWWEAQPNAHTLIEYVEHVPAHERAHREQLRPAMAYVR